MRVVRYITAGLVAAAAIEAEHSRDHKKKFLSKSQALATSERTDLLKTHHVFGFATDASKTKSALKVIHCQAQQGSSICQQKTGGMTTSAKAEAFTSGSSTLLTTCNYGATTEVCILAKKYGECVPQYITALPNGNTTGTCFITIEDIKDVLDITVIPSSFETVNFADVDRGVKLVGQSVPVCCTSRDDFASPSPIASCSKVTKARLRGYPDKDFNNLHFPPSMETLDFSDNQLELFNPSEWAELPLTELYVLRNNRLEHLNNVTFSPTLHTMYDHVIAVPHVKNKQSLAVSSRTTG
ncbi:hypothetical protein AaE_001668 [Aphanomyces astaci]|uniref:Uncharacterized protein n=1 Tax=Aphanomyces astaci TaxID=112090 RepID=A0A6A5AHJ3_APHAT|nr:hypothetical protein AaE_001668 [Aphanomyces astaci]